MPFVNAKCTNCGAGLEVDSTKEAAICRKTIRALPNKQPPFALHKGNANNPQIIRGSTLQINR